MVSADKSTDPESNCPAQERRTYTQSAPRVSRMWVTHPLCSPSKSPSLLPSSQMTSRANDLGKEHVHHSPSHLWRVGDLTGPQIKVHFLWGHLSPPRLPPSPGLQAQRLGSSFSLSPSRLYLALFLSLSAHLFQTLSLSFPTPPSLLPQPCGLEGSLPKKQLGFQRTRGVGMKTQRTGGLGSELTSSNLHRVYQT